MQNLYQLLGIHPNASSTDIQKALVKAAQNQSASLETLQKVRDTLLNADTRRRYDAALRQHHPDAWDEPEEETEANEQPPAVAVRRIKRTSSKEQSQTSAGSNSFFNKVLPTKTWHLALICALAFGAGWVSDRLYIQYRVSKAMSEVAEAFGGKGKKDSTRKKQDHGDTVQTTWQYKQRTDQMRGTTSEAATLTSENEVNLGFPYEHVRVGLITPKDANQVLIFTNGQLDCRSPAHDHKGCEIAIRFDNQPVEYISVSEVEAGDSVRIDSQHQQKFIDNLRRSQKLVIELSMYKAGTEQFTFNVSGYKY